MTVHHRIRCSICRMSLPAFQVIPGRFVRPVVAQLIAADHAHWTEEGYICQQDLNHYRSVYVQRLLTEEKGELTELEHEVVNSLKEHDILAQDLNSLAEDDATLGQRLADRVASFGGSWTFILLFSGVLSVWIIVNSIALLGRPFDPFPFILLNLVLSCLAALQAPVIMMSQNR